VPEIIEPLRLAIPGSHRVEGEPSDLTVGVLVPVLTPPKQPLALAMIVPDPLTMELGKQLSIAGV
jgi:hypothetical protein